MLSLTSAPLSLAPTAVMGRASAPKMSFADEFTFDSKPWTSSEIKDKAGLEALAKKLNPTVGLWDPLGIAEASPETIGWFRHAEIKHGRVAMAAFVGFCLQSNGVCFPWNLQAPFLGVNSGIETISFADISAAGGPGAQWDALPSAAKLQIIGAIGFLEMWGESSVALEMDGQQHYVRGGKPGYYPSLKGRMPHPVPLNLWDPVGFTKKMTPEQKEKSLLAEVNNGRLAQIGIMGFLAESQTPGSVPGLTSLGLKGYSGNVMIPFEGNFHVF
jgi:hypothetical protein